MGRFPRVAASGRKFRPSPQQPDEDRTGPIRAIQCLCMCHPIGTSNFTNIPSLTGTSMARPTLHTSSLPAHPILPHAHSGTHKHIIEHEEPPLLGLEHLAPVAVHSLNHVVRANQVSAPSAEELRGQK